MKSAKVKYNYVRPKLFKPHPLSFGLICSGLFLVLPLHTGYVHASTKRKVIHSYVSKPHQVRARALTTTSSTTASAAVQSGYDNGFIVVSQPTTRVKRYHKKHHKKRLKRFVQHVAHTISNNSVSMATNASATSQATNSATYQKRVVNVNSRNTTSTSTVHKKRHLANSSNVSSSSSQASQSSVSTTTASVSDHATLRNNILKTARQYLGDSYAYGATGENNSFDCSGLVQKVYSLNNVSLPRVAQDQYSAGQAISESQLQKGDLVFFGDSNEAISHVGIYEGNGKMLDAQNNGVIEEFIHAPWWNIVGFAKVV